MIPREILKQVRRVEIATRGLVNDVFSGEYHSVFKGRGMNFAEVREYQHGDDIRAIDWNVTARTGAPFIKVFDDAVASVGSVDFLAQGTLYPDVIESVSAIGGPSVTIKSHHNVGGLPEHLDLNLLEPIRNLFKDEVRQIGLELGLAHSVVFRHPFPGPGLGVRVLGEVRREYLEIVREADAIFLEELRKAQLYDSVSQAFAVFLPVKSVGVVGDNRAYEYVIALRAVETVDFMTADWKRLPAELLTTVASRIINEVRGVSRVTYDISAKPPATIEWE